MPTSIVSTLYRSAPYLDEFVARCLALMQDNDELILVDDGSPDESLSLAKEHALRDSRIVVVELARNFGHHHAILAGLGQAVGDKVFFVDSDLEEAPELVVEFSSIMEAGAVDVVFGVHNHSQGSLLRRATSRAFWFVFNWASDSTTPLNICNVRLMKRRYVDALLSLPEANIFLGGMFHWVGFKQIAIPVERILRRSQSTYSIAGRVKLAVRSIAAFSTAPLKGMFLLGTIMSTLSLLLAIYFVVLKVIDPKIQLGFTSLIISIWFLSGIIIACLGVLGIYLAYVYTETKRRPRVIIKDVFRGHSR
jgi:putative glycosyltransferase